MWEVSLPALSNFHPSQASATIPQTKLKYTVHGYKLRFYVSTFHHSRFRGLGSRGSSCLSHIPYLTPDI